MKDNFRIYTTSWQKQNLITFWTIDRERERESQAKRDFKKNLKNVAPKLFKKNLLT